MDVTMDSYFGYRTCSSKKLASSVHDYSECRWSLAFQIVLLNVEKSLNLSILSIALNPLNLSN